MESGSDTSTAALQVISGEEKRTQCLGIWFGHPVPGGYKYGDLALQVGETRVCDSKIWSWDPQDSGPKMIALVKASSNCKRHTRPFVRECAPHQQPRNCLTVMKIWSWVPDGSLTPGVTWLWLWLRDSLESAVRECSSWAVRAWRIALVREQ
jgi:hypothetical protein